MKTVRNTSAIIARPSAPSTMYTASETPRLIMVANAAPLPFRQRAVIINGQVTSLANHADSYESRHNR